MKDSFEARRERLGKLYISFQLLTKDRGESSDENLLALMSSDVHWQYAIVNTSADDLESLVSYALNLYREHAAREFAEGISSKYGSVHSVVQALFEAVAQSQYANDNLLTQLLRCEEACAARLSSKIVKNPNIRTLNCLEAALVFPYTSWKRAEILTAIYIYRKDTLTKEQMAALIDAVNPGLMTLKVYEHPKVDAVDVMRYYWRAYDKKLKDADLSSILKVLANLI